ncbi:hypothetical protein FRC11_003144, partial [Ceratobasidium sp. 423]
MTAFLKLEPISSGGSPPSRFRTDIPDAQAVLAEAKALIEGVQGWPEGKTYNHIRTNKKMVPGPAWHSRTSVHGPEEGTFGEIWNCLGVKHSLNEKEYVPEVATATCLGSFGSFEGACLTYTPSHLIRLTSNGTAWSMGYHFTPPVSDRVFTVLITCVLEEKPSQQGFVISLPFDVSTDQDLKGKEPQGVRGHYVSVECIKEIDGKVEW